MEGGSNSTSCMLAFGHNNNTCNGPCHVSMMPSMSSHHHHMDSNNPLFLPLPPTNNQDPNHNSTSGSPSMILNNTGCYFMENNNNDDDGSSSSSMKAKIMSHPHYHRLLAAYVNCQKVGAPPEVVARLEEACATAATVGGTSSTSYIGEDPALDQFMEAYCEMLIKYEQELSKPFKEAMVFLQRIECQFKALTVSSSNSAYGTETFERNGSSEEETDVNNKSFIDPLAEDRELKDKLLQRYSGYLGSLKQEFMKKRKKGKLPKEARQQLLDWWSRHYKWPYPSESQKLALAESTGLDQKQINNWFINQRKRHWKPSEDMQFVVMDGTHNQHYFMDNVIGNAFPMDLNPTYL
ncbi:homeobox protein SBH1-like [Gossypium arboreum]|uniref:Homeobox protein SBH1-like n=1 Tax=Gossypium arboreum TaxID=29729 RepID=A0ABR0NAG6_GOSAR|nr:homeobox protein SBH1-like [Gossypium arboreum]KAK5791982.1 hypothetical protein PVK06_033095 [Gossypium arboreum]